MVSAYKPRKCKLHHDEVCKPNITGWTPLHDAAVNGNKDDIRRLVEEMAIELDQQAPNGSPTSTYKVAIDHCSAQCYGSRYSSCISSDNMPNKDGPKLLSSSTYTMTVLHAALNAGQQSAVKLLLEMGADINEMVTDCGSTALLASCHVGEAGYVEDVRILLQYGADVNATDTAGMTALHKAMRPTLCTEEEEVEVVRLLITGGAEVDAVSYTQGPPDIDTLVDGNTPLHCAAVHGDCAVARMRLLVQYGADVNARTPLLGATALHMAACLGREQAVNVLLELEADAGIKCKNDNTARDLACENGFHDIVNTLDEHWWRHSVRSFGGAVPRRRNSVRSIESIMNIMVQLEDDLAEKASTKKRSNPARSLLGGVSSLLAPLRQVSGWNYLTKGRARAPVNGSGYNKSHSFGGERQPVERQRRSADGRHPTLRTITSLK